MSKIADVVGLLKEDWIAAAELCRRLGWQPHTLRGALSTYAKKNGVKIERHRLNKITSYRIAVDSPVEVPVSQSPVVASQPSDLDIPEFLRRT